MAQTEAQTEPEGARLRGVLNPVSKLALLAPVLAALPVAPAPLLWLMAGLALGMGLWLGIIRRMLIRMAIVLIPLAIAVFAIHGIFMPSPGSQPLIWGLEWHPEGILRANLIVARLACLLTAALVVVLTTGVPALADALEDKGVPPALAYLLTAPISLATTVAEEARALSEALQVRGVVVRGSPLARLRAISLIVAPLVRSFLIEAAPRARALEGRGFGASRHRSLLHPPHDSVPQRALRWGALLLALALIAVKVLQ